MVEGRALDDDGNVLLKFDNGAAGVLMASQVAAGEENALKIRVYGEKGGIEWAQHEPNTLLVKWLDAANTDIKSRRRLYRSFVEVCNTNCRTPGGHPEGYLEAFGNIYRNFALNTWLLKWTEQNQLQKCWISQELKMASEVWLYRYMLLPAAKAHKNGQSSRNNGHDQSKIMSVERI